MKLSTTEIARIVGVDLNTIRRWKREGHLTQIDSRKCKSGRPENVFEGDELLKFLEKQYSRATRQRKKKHMECIIRLKRYYKDKDQKTGPPEPVEPERYLDGSLKPPKVEEEPEKAKPAKRKTLNPDEDIAEISAMLQRLRDAEKEAHDEYQDAQKENDPFLVTSCQKIWMEFVSNRTRLEKQIPEILLAKKLYRPIDEIRQNCARIGTIFKNSLMGTGAKVRAQIMSIVPREEDAVTIEKMFVAANKEALKKAIKDLGKV